MSRSVELWSSDNPDTPFPPRVRLRIFDRAGGRCACCGRKITARDKWQIDHITPLIAGGANSESNAQVLCDWCHKDKTRADVAEKFKVARIRARDLGIAKTKRPMMGSKASGWKKPMNGPAVRRG